MLSNAGNVDQCYQYLAMLGMLWNSEQGWAKVNKSEQFKQKAEITASWEMLSNAKQCWECCGILSNAEHFRPKSYPLCTVCTQRACQIGSKYKVITSKFILIGTQRFGTTIEEYSKFSANLGPTKCVPLQYLTTSYNPVNEALGNDF